MIIDLKRTVGYICPVCSSLITGKFDAFSLSASAKLEARCPYHSSSPLCVSIRRKNGKYIITANCAMCGGTHIFRAAEKSFWHERLISYRCPEGGADIFYIGDDDSVNEAIENYEISYDDYDDDYDSFMDDDLPHDSAVSSHGSGSDFTNGRKKGGKSSAPGGGTSTAFHFIFNAAMEYLRKMSEEHNLLCVCGSENIYFNRAEKEVLLICRRCGRSKIIDLTEEHFMELLAAKKLIIE